MPKGFYIVTCYLAAACHNIWMMFTRTLNLAKAFAAGLSIAALLYLPVSAQIAPPNDLPQAPAIPELPNLPDLPPRSGQPDSDDPDNDNTDNDSGNGTGTGENISDQADDNTDIIPEGTEGVIEKPDYSQLSRAAERDLRLSELFIRLKAEDNADDANLIAEEIWVLWLDSGSASINLLLRRGSDAQTKGDHDKARRLFNHVIDLAPDYAEGWARSARLALEDKEYSRALNESITALNLEPRHFYVLWTMGNIFEHLGRQDEALEAYREAAKLYPELTPVKERLKLMETEIDGDVL